MKTKKTLIGLVVIIIAMVLDNLVAIASLVLRQKTINEQLTADYPVNQMNSAVETVGYSFCILLFAIGIVLVLPEAYRYIKARLNKTKNKEGEEK